MTAVREERGIHEKIRKEFEDVYKIGRKQEVYKQEKEIAHSIAQQQRMKPHKLEAKHLSEEEEEAIMSGEEIRQRSTTTIRQRKENVNYTNTCYHNPLVIKHDERDNKEGMQQTVLQVQKDTFNRGI